MKKTKKKFLTDAALLAAAGMISAFTMHIFVYPNSFAPTGIDGICAMLQYVTKISAGWLFMLINIPMLAVAFFVLSKEYAVKALIFTLLQSGIVLILEALDFYRYHAQQMILPPVFAGIALGFRLALMLKINSATGGIDVIASIFSKKKPELKFEFVLFLISIAILTASFFVYGNLESVLFGIVFAWINSKIIDVTGSIGKEAVEVKIITDNEEAFREDILKRFKHGATVLNAKGLYSESDKIVLICIIQKRQCEAFKRYLSGKPGVFAVFSKADDVVGYFVRGKDEAPVPGGQYGADA